MAGREIIRPDWSEKGGAEPPSLEDRLAKGGFVSSDELVDTKGVIERPNWAVLPPGAEDALDHATDFDDLADRWNEQVEDAEDYEPVESL